MECLSLTLLEPQFQPIVDDLEQAFGEIEKLLEDDIIFFGAGRKQISNWLFKVGGKLSELGIPNDSIKEVKEGIISKLEFIVKYHRQKNDRKLRN